MLKGSTVNQDMLQLNMVHAAKAAIRQDLCDDFDGGLRRTDSAYGIKPASLSPVIRSLNHFISILLTAGVTTTLPVFAPQLHRNSASDLASPRFLLCHS